MTGREAEQYAQDVATFGERVAYWFWMESNGWDALYELQYWAEVKKKCVSYKEPHHWMGSNAA